MSNHSTTFYNPVTKSHDFSMHPNLGSLPYPPRATNNGALDQFAHQNGYFQPPLSVSTNVSPVVNHENTINQNQQHGVVAADVEEISGSAGSFRPNNGRFSIEQQSVPHNGSSAAKAEVFGAQQQQPMRCDQLSYPPLDHSVNSAAYPMMPHQGPWYPHPAISPTDPSSLMFDSSGYPRNLSYNTAVDAAGKNMNDVISGGHGVHHPAVGINKDFPYPWGVKHDDVIMTKPRHSNSDCKS